MLKTAWNAMAPQHPEPSPPLPLVHPIARLPAEWTSHLAQRGERSFRALEVFRWIHRQAETEPQRMTTLPATLRDELFRDAKSAGKVSHVHRAHDGTRKILVELADGASIETVLLPRVSGPGSAAQLEQEEDDEEDEDEEEDQASGTADARRPAKPVGASAIRVTQCISTQVGCAMGCVFCASGVAGLKRNLGPEEIVAQVLIAKRALEPGEELRNVVYMGMGEPLHNYAATKRSLELLTHREGIALSKRRVTVSTSGLIPEIARLGEDFQGQIGLAISLHAPDDERRGALMPINRKYPLAELMRALHDFPLPKRRRITIEYTLVANQNDSPEDARKLAKLLSTLRVKINLIPMNPIAGSDLASPAFGRVLAFQSVLTERGYSCFIRRQRGDDVSAACGQLALLGGKRKVRPPPAPNKERAPRRG